MENEEVPGSPDPAFQRPLNPPELIGEYIQLQSWDELIAWLEREGMKKVGDSVQNWNPAPKRKSKKKPPQSEGLF